MPTNGHYLGRHMLGFTLIELVATIILIGFISVVVLPKFFSRSGFAEIALRDELVALIRNAQQLAMFDHSGNCYGVFFGPNGVEVRRDTTTLLETRIDFDGDYAGLGTSISPVTSALFFDGMGNLLTGGSSCASPSNIPTNVTTVTITGGVASLFRIHPTGYIARQG